MENHADSVIGGEYERPLLDLVHALEAGVSPEIAGVTTAAYRSRPNLERQSFAPPRRDSLPPLHRYARLESSQGLAVTGYVEASRGCLHTCLHCPITPVYGGRFFIVPAEIVLDDVRVQVQQGAQHITFGDPDFLNGPGHSMKILRAMHAEFLHVTFDATIKIEHIIERRELIPELRELGCAFVLSAVESVSDEVLRRLDKGHTRAEVAAAV
ncbi:MAG: radical SAM protein, partial [Chloroflexia bacterium]